MVAEVAECPSSFGGSVYPQHLKWWFSSCVFGAAESEGNVAHRSSGGAIGTLLPPVILRL